jgi:hypothetical protein
MAVRCLRLTVKSVVRRDFHACCNNPQDMDRTKQDLNIKAQMFRTQCWAFCESLLRILGILISPKILAFCKSRREVLKDIKITRLPKFIKKE